MKKISITVLAIALMTSCVSKKKYVALQEENGQITSELTKTTVEKEELEAKFAEIEARVEDYNNKINSLTEENNARLVNVNDVAVISNDAKAAMMATLEKVDPAELANAKTLKDSMNVAIAYNLKQHMESSEINEDQDIAVNIDETVVMISIADELLFNTASYRVSNKADDILKRLADVINSEESLEVMVEGHTDDRSVRTEQLRNNWDLSVLRASSVVQKLQNDFGVAPEKLIAAGRASFHPIADNETKEGQAQNRRTRIVILPNIDKFFALMAAE
ncbi:cell envelope biogenesis protein OmpA [Robertkochia marina]|uniref:Cell envelope biogenesis protein OmpA n=1 Tax=Robertkochia marina TaxID=1227945 RepID=A0A4S3M2P8_9FLAO|nr:OmpA family protein [Robertkochia marina]THD67889.1 cell envelope biogenesis protein OmpA [Robertkochia marina]TRZ42072.1 cell envelope biogenesis protein OmpA [Robertkochia marina]